MTVNNLETIITVNHLANSGQLSTDNCHTYEITGSDMSVSLSAVSSHSVKHHSNLSNIE
jgi:hypothetical protein